MLTKPQFIATNYTDVGLIKSYVINKQLYSEQPVLGLRGG